MLDASPDIELIRNLVSRRLMDEKKIAAAQKELNRMLVTLWSAGYVTLTPDPPRGGNAEPEEVEEKKEEPTGGGLFAEFLAPKKEEKKKELTKIEYVPKTAEPTESLQKLLHLRGVNPLYGVFLVNNLGIANEAERIQAFESLLEMPYSVGKGIRVPKHEDLPPGPLATTRLDERLLKLGLATAEELGAQPDDDDDDDRRRGGMFEEERVFVLTLGDKLKRLFDHDFPGVHGIRINPVWVAGEVLEFESDFNKYITSKGLQKQEGMIFRHLLRLILLLGEFMELSPPEMELEEWQAEISSLRDRLTKCCRGVDPSSTDKMVGNS